MPNSWKLVTSMNARPVACQGRIPEPPRPHDCRAVITIARVLMHGQGAYSFDFDRPAALQLDDHLYVLRPPWVGVLGATDFAELFVRPVYHLPPLAFELAASIGRLSSVEATSLSCLSSNCVNAGNQVTVSCT